MSGASGRLADLLFVDDDLDDARFLLRGFEALSQRVRLRCAASVDEALAQLGPQARPPDILLLDIRLPGRGGFELLDIVRGGREPLRCTPVIMLSVSNDPHDIRRAYCNGANAYIRKPADLGGYVKLAHCLTDFWLGAATLVHPCGDGLDRF